MRSLMILCLLCLAGCGRESTSPERVVARVNDYQVTASEFKRELLLADRVHSSYPQSARKDIREAVLDNIVVRQVLLEEAQKQGFDKDPAFMREVESYWRQALLKAMLNKKSAEFISSGTVDSGEAGVMLDNWVKELRSKAVVEKFPDEISQVYMRTLPRSGVANDQ